MATRDVRKESPEVIQLHGDSHFIPIPYEQRDFRSGKGDLGA
jgi:hypothetical protein